MKLSGGKEGEENRREKIKATKKEEKKQKKSIFLRTKKKKNKSKILDPQILNQLVFSFGVNRDSCVESCKKTGWTK